jgi:DNA mismatch repair protein MutS2
LKPGDKIFFKPGQSEAVVLEADDDKWTAVIQMEEGLRLSCKYSDLGTIPPSSGKKRFPPAGTKQGTGPGGALAAEKGKLDLDLRGKLVDQAITLLDKFLDDALLVDLPFVRIIHGKGTGALKEAIHKHLPGSHPEVEFSMAEPAQGGAGVTIIKFRKT